MTVYTVRLEDETTGIIDSDTTMDAFMGKVVTVNLHDENGIPIEKEGRLIDVLDESEY